MDSAAALDCVRAYHQRTKHDPRQYARSRGFLDWANQPNPFREFSGAPRVDLPLAEVDTSPPFGRLFTAKPTQGEPLTRLSLGRFLELSLALSAWKQSGDSRWALRINPSSGNLHPTEGYVLLPIVENVASSAGVFHYVSRDHVLEQRANWNLNPGPPLTGFYLALSSIVWREAWKYGERAFRYCQHDVGHALAAARIAAAVLGWSLKWTSQVSDPALAQCLGLDRSEDYHGAEPEIPELLMWISVTPGAVAWPLPDRQRPVTWTGRANRLSAEHWDWPVIDEVTEATIRLAEPSIDRESSASCGDIQPPTTSVSAAQILRQRRSAVAFDGTTGLALPAFLSLLDLTLPRDNVPPFDVGLWRRRVNLAIFAHRIEGLAPGLYWWQRDGQGMAYWRELMKREFDWLPIPTRHSPPRLFQLVQADMRDFARAVSCQQEIAGDGAFSLGMLAGFEAQLQAQGGAGYRQLFWETGMIGQMLYLGAEAVGLRGTGIGCFFDDLMHTALGLEDLTAQSLYHFTVGGPVDDPRLRTDPPYRRSQGMYAEGSHLNIQ